MIIIGSLAHLTMMSLYFIVGEVTNWTFEGEAVGGAVLGYGFFFVIPAMIIAIIIDVGLIIQILIKKIKKEHLAVLIFYYIFTLIAFLPLIWPQFETYEIEFLKFIMKN
ncbi:hypothetical protein [Nautilia lithotrophica]